MYINRTLLLLMAIAIAFVPTAREWVTSGGTAWYRPYLIWALVVAVAWWSRGKSYGDDV